MKEILLSMKPEWFNMVISGRKLYEYRKHFPKESIFDFIRALLVFTYLEDKSCTDCMLE